MARSDGEGSTMTKSAVLDVEPPKAAPRRFDLEGGLALAAVVAASAVAPAQAQAQAAMVTDVDILNFALNLEYLETEYYLRGLTGSGLTAAETTGTGTLGTVTGGRQVNFTDTSIQQFLTEIANDERGQVNFIRGALGAQAVARPTLNFTDAFNALGAAAGIGPFDPFANQTNFILGGLLFCETGVTAYHGGGRFIQNKTILDSAAGILAVEAYQSGTLKLLTYQAGAQAIANYNAAVNVKNNLGGVVADQPITLNGVANLVPTDANSIAFSRTPAQVLGIVYEGGAQNNYGFFPNRVNGTIR